MKRVLITGMSGTGKSTIIEALSRMGYRAVDADADAWSEWVFVGAAANGVDAQAEAGSPWRYHDWLWREDRMHELLSSQDGEILFVAGTAPNQGKFRARFDQVVVLTAPESVIVDRLARRTNNGYGKSAHERARVLEQMRTVEPLLRRAATAEIDTSRPLEQVVDAILAVSRR